jgi:hypothetical protein
MKADELENKLIEYYDKLKNPKYIVKDWIITSENLYEKHKNKLKLINIISYNILTNEIVIVAECKNKYYAIKYSDKFICFKESETEYGLVIDGYDLLALNKINLYYDNNSRKVITFKEIIKLMDWKVSKEVKGYFDYFS